MYSTSSKLYAVVSMTVIRYIKTKTRLFVLKKNLCLLTLLTCTVHTVCTSLTIVHPVCTDYSVVITE